MTDIWKRAGREHVLDIKESHGVTYLSFPSLEKTGAVKHAFSTRLGGVSEGKYSTMNFTFTRGDNPEHVRENYRRMANALDVDMEKMVLSFQTHTTNVRKVTAEDAGKGLLRKRNYVNTDGLMTDAPGLTLVTFYADCVPLFFVDPHRRAIALSHSGWRGTVKKMGRVTVQAMGNEYGSRPEDIIACIGPSICRDCYEVGEEVAGEFRKAFPENRFREILYPHWNGKYQLDLWKANEIVLLEAGIKPEHIQTTDICTKCNSEYLFSHREAGDDRGNLAAFLCLGE